MDKIIKCKVKEFSKRGFGIGYYPHPVTDQPVAVEIAHALVDDEIEVAVYKKRKRYRKGKLLNIIQPSPKRIETKCEHVGICGGCVWQAMEYNEQLSQKEKTVFEIFNHFKNVELRKIIPCENPYYYRNKMEFSFSENKAKTKFLGLMIAHASTYVFNVNQCHISNPWVSKVLNAVRNWWEQTDLKAYDIHDNTGHLRTLTLRESFMNHQKMVILTVSGNPQFALPQNIINSFVDVIKKTLPNEDPSVFIQIHQAIKGKPTQFFEMHLSGDAFIQEKMTVSTNDLYFKISPTSFFQPNSKQAERLYNEVLKIASISKNDVVYDLYCGTGTLGMAFAKFVKKVVAIELNAHAVCDAKENLKLNQISNMEIIQGDVGKILTKTNNLPPPDLVVIDPPRAGLDKEALLNLKKISVKKIIYVSCNPYSQLENINELCSFGYQLKILQPLDQFPHTYHIENIAYLTLET